MSTQTEHSFRGGYGRDMLAALALAATVGAACGRGVPVSEPTQLTSGDTYDTFIRYSPSGEHMAFTRRRGDTEDGSAAIVVMRSDGTEVREVTTGTDWDLGGSWSPDGTMLTYSSDRGGSKDIWTINLTTDERRRLTDLPGREEQSDWSPDGSTIVFHADESGNSDIWAADVATGTLTQLTDSPADDYSPRYSPDGQWIAFRADRHDDNVDIFVMDAGGEASTGAPARRLTTDPGPDWNPAWLPNGQRIAFTTRRTPPGVAIWSVDLGGLDPVRLTPEISGIGLAAPSPDGEKLAYQVYERQEYVYRVEMSTEQAERLTSGGAETSPAVSPRGDLVYVSRGQIFVRDSSTGRRLTDRDAPESDPAWSPDGSAVAFVSASGDGDVALFVIDAEGGVARQITSAPGIQAPRWCANDDLVVTIEGEQGRPQAARVTLSTGRTRQLTSGVSHLATDCSLVQGGALVTRGATVNPDVYRVSLDGSDEPVRIIEDASGARWLPDGRIAFLSNRHGDLEIFLLHSDGTVRVTNSPGNERHISPAGTEHLVYSLNVGRSHIWVRPQGMRSAKMVKVSEGW